MIMKKLWLSLALSASTALLAAAVPKELIKKLDADEFATRSKAQKDLMKWAEKAKPDEIKELRMVYQNVDSPEVKFRLEDVLDLSVYEAVPNTRGFVGISMGEMFGGVRVDRVERNTPAHKVGLRVGDIIEGVDKHDLTPKKANIEEATQFFSRYVKSKNAGEKLQLKVRRNGDLLEKTLKLGDYDKFNNQVLRQQNQMIFPDNGNRFQVRPGIQLRVQPMPRNAPKADLEQQEKLRKEAEAQLRKALKQAIERQEKLQKEQREHLKELKKKLNK